MRYEIKKEIKLFILLLGIALMIVIIIVVLRSHKFAVPSSIKLKTNTLGQIWSDNYRRL